MAICLSVTAARFAPVRMALQNHGDVKSRMRLRHMKGRFRRKAGDDLSKTAGAGFARLKNAPPAQMG
jgi:hypothetical protein